MSISMLDLPLSDFVMKINGSDLEAHAGEVNLDYSDAEADEELFAGFDRQQLLTPDSFDGACVSMGMSMSIHTSM